jgi:hypothetical protein
MYQKEKNTAAKLVVTQDAKTWKLRVNATIWHVLSRFGSSYLEVSQTWLAKNDSSHQRPLLHSKLSAGARCCDPSKENQL